MLLDWCLVRQWIHVPALTYYGSASFRSSSKVVDTALILQRQVRTVHTVQGRRLPCHGADDVSLGLVQRPQRFPSCSTLIKYSMSLSCSSSRFVRSRGRRSRSHSCNSNFPGQVVARPLCATTVASGRRSSVQFMDGCERPCDHARQWKCLRFRSSRIFGEHSSSQQRQVLNLTVAAMMGLFERFASLFALLRLSRS